MATDYTQTVRRSPVIEAAQENYIDLLTQQVGRAPGSIGVPTLAELGPQVAGQNILTQAAQQQAATQAGLGQLQFDATGAVTGAGTGTGVAGYQPFLDQAEAYSGPQAFQQFMSPYQQQVIDTTLTEFDRQTAMGVPQLAANAIQAGAFGGGREGIAQAEYANTAARNRAALQAQLLGQGFTQANQLAGNAFEQQRNQLAYNEPLSRIQQFGSGIASQASGSPMTTTQQSLGGGAGGVGPLSQALSAGLNAYGLGSIFGGR